MNKNITNLPLPQKKVAIILKNARALKKIKTDNENDVLTFIVQELSDYYDIKLQFNIIERLSKELFFQIRKDRDVLPIIHYKESSEQKNRVAFSYQVQVIPARIITNIEYAWGCKNYTEYKKELNKRLKRSQVS